MLEQVHIKRSPFGSGHISIYNVQTYTFAYLGFTKKKKKKDKQTYLRHLKYYDIFRNYILVQTDLELYQRVKLLSENNQTILK